VSRMCRLVTLLACDRVIGMDEGFGARYGPEAEPQSDDDTVPAQRTEPPSMQGSTGADRAPTVWSIVEASSRVSVQDQATSRSRCRPATWR
jgi:hypothetical protein